MAKKHTQALKNIRSKNNSRNFGQGIGIFVPSTMTMAEWQSLRREWDKKLTESGHDEIEQFSTNCTGHFSPFFIKSIHNNSLSGSAATVARIYKPQTAEYYRRIGIFRYHANLWNLWRKPKQSRLMRLILQLLADGATLQRITDWITNEAPLDLRQKRSIYWAWARVDEIERKMDAWFKRNPEMIE